METCAETGLREQFDQQENCYSAHSQKGSRKENQKRKPAEEAKQLLLERKGERNA